jgi:hypothetical protein
MKNEIINALRTFAQKRPNLELNNYATLSGYLEESRAITKDLHHARKLLRKVELSSITAQDIVNASNEAFSGRLTIIPTNSYSDEFKIEYCIGQYFATEYRKAVCAVLARALWNHWREDRKDGDLMTTGQQLRAIARSELGASLARAYFN